MDQTADRPRERVLDRGHSLLRWRLAAAGSHLAISAIVGLLSATIVFVWWFPWPYRIVSGGAELFLLVTGADIVLGPLLTLAVFDRRKKNSVLARDLAVIAALQIVALGYGLHTTYIARPVIIALEDDRFRVSSAIEVLDSELPSAPPGLQSLSLSGPVLVSTRKPANEDERFDAIQMGMGGFDVGTRPKFWQAWGDEGRRDALSKSHPLKTLLDRKRPEDRDALDRAVARTGKSVAELNYLPLLARRTDWVVLLDARSGEPVGFAPIDGF